MENCGITPVYNIDGNNRNDGMWGNNGWEWIILLFLLMAWGGNGWNNGGGFGGGSRDSFYCGSPWATQADVRTAVDQQTLISKLDQQTYGLADSTYALNNAIMQGFHGVDNAVCNLGYQTQQGFNNLGYQMKDCCCETQRLIERGFCDTNYNIATQASETRSAIHNTARDIVENANSNTRAILDFLTQDKIATLTAENQSLKFRASQADQNAFITANQSAQTAELIRRLGADCPVPAYVVPNPNCCYNPFGFGYGTGFGYGNNGCGCGCGC